MLIQDKYSVNITPFVVNNLQAGVKYSSDIYLTRKKDDKMILVTIDVNSEDRDDNDIKLQAISDGFKKIINKLNKEKNWKEVTEISL